MELELLRVKLADNFLDVREPFLLAKGSAKPLFMETAMQAVFSGIFGPAPIRTEEG